MNRSPEVSEHLAAGRPANLELKKRFESKCPNLVERTDLYSLFYRARPMGHANWIAFVAFEQAKIPELHLHVEGDRWWLTSGASIRDGKNLLELRESDCDFEDKLRLRIEEVLP